MGKIALSRALFRLKGGFSILSAASNRTKTIITRVQGSKRSASSAALVMVKTTKISPFSDAYGRTVSFFYIHV